MRFEDRDFQGEKIQLDGNEFYRCRFSQCTLIYAALQLPLLKSCSFADCTWSYTGAAAKTLQFLSALHREFRELVEQTFEDIRKGNIHAL